MKKYDDKTFKDKVLNTHKWIKSIDETYDSKVIKIKVTCHNNHQNFINVKDLTRPNRVKFCKECVSESTKERLCKNCGKILDKKDKRIIFCSHSCAASFNNRNRLKKSLKKCLYCNNTISKNSKSDFCSLDCRTTYLNNKKIDLWKNDNTVVSSESCPRWLRRYLIEKADHSCERCGWSVKNEFTGKIPLQIHHKDGNFRNYSEDNLEILCPNCHSLTENYGSRNIGSGRPLRYNKK